MVASERQSLDMREWTVKGHDKKVVCYWGTWANYRPKDGKFTPEDIDPSLCTNLIYSFAGLDAETDSIKPLDAWMDLEEGYGLQGYRKATDLKYAYPHLKVIISICRFFSVFFHFRRLKMRTRHATWENKKLRSYTMSITDFKISS